MKIKREIKNNEAESIHMATSPSIGLIPKKTDILEHNSITKIHNERQGRSNLRCDDSLTIVTIRFRRSNFETFTKPTLKVKQG